MPTNEPENTDKQKVEETLNRIFGMFDEPENTDKQIDKFKKLGMLMSQQFHDCERGMMRRIDERIMDGLRNDIKRCEEAKDANK